MSALLLRDRYLRDQATGESVQSQPARRQGKPGAAARACVLWRSLHARGDAYWREEGHDTPSTLTIVLLERSSHLRDQATGESASAATGQTGCGSAGMRALALAAC